MKKFLSVTTLVLAGLNLLDMGITAYLLTHCPMVVESNLLMGAIWDASPVLFVVLKLGLSACFAVLSRRLSSPRRWIYLASVPTTALYACVVGWSLFVLAATF